MPHKRSRAFGLLLASLTSFLWGTVPVAGKIALGGMSAAALSTLRLLCAGALIALVLGARRTRPSVLFSPPPRLVYLAAFGLAGNYICYMLGLERTGAATTHILIQTAPLFLILLSIFWLKERPTARQLAGAAVALLGVCLVCWDSGRRDASLDLPSVIGMGLVIVSALAWGFYAAVHRRIGEHHGSGRTMMWIFGLSALLVALATPLESARSPDALQGIAIAYLCLNTVAAYWCFAESLRHVEATVVAVILTLGPLVTLALVALGNRLGWERIGREELNVWKLCGAALVIGGVGLAVTAHAGHRPGAARC